MEQALAQQSSSAARDFLTVPFLDAFGRRLEIDQLGLPHLSLDYHFRKVPRFDRCTTCHQGIDKSLAHRPTQPRYGREQRIDVRFDGSRPSPVRGRADDPQVLAGAYGFVLAPRGMLDTDVPTVGQVFSESKAARGSGSGRCDSCDQR